MNMLATLKTDDSIVADKDSLGGGAGALDTNIYATKVNLAFFKKSAGGALAVVLHLGTTDNREIRQTLWVTSGDAKGNKNYYETKDGERKYLPGFTVFRSLSALTVGKEPADLTVEKKVVNLYSPEAGKEVPTEVDMLTDLLDQEIYTALFKQVVDKNAKGDDGLYHPTGETREENEIDKFFRAADKLTLAEIQGGATEATFFDQWKAKWEGQTRDKTSKDAPKANGVAGAPNRPAAAAPAAGKPTQSLFG
jgi:hypothetical protein